MQQWNHNALNQLTTESQPTNGQTMEKRLHTAAAAVVAVKSTNTNLHKIRRWKIYFTPTAEICNDLRENAEFDYNLGNSISYFDYTWNRTTTTTNNEQQHQQQ